jgi:hypothetical protein
MAVHVRHDDDQIASIDEALERLPALAAHRAIVEHRLVPTRGREATIEAFRTSQPADDTDSHPILRQVYAFSMLLSVIADIAASQVAERTLRLNKISLSANRTPKNTQPPR